VPPAGSRGRAAMFMSCFMVINGTCSINDCQRVYMRNAAAEF